jgi:glycosyltransferase involved in cell wall biosynthesis
MNSRTLPRISIITPSFNQGEFIGECLESLLNQGYPNLELVVVDGGSSDDSVSVIRQFEQHLHWWCSEPDEGQYDAIRKGFEHSSGAIMGWLNSDDKHHDFSLFKLAFLFGAQRNVQWLTGRHSFWRDDGAFLGAAKTLLTWNAREIVAHMMNGASCIQQESTFWRRSLWDRAGACMATQLELAGDYELWCRFALHARLHTVDTPLAGFRRQPKQKTATRKDDYLAEGRAVASGMMPELTQASTWAMAPPSPLSLRADEFRKFLQRCKIDRPIPPGVLLSARDLN